MLSNVADLMELLTDKRIAYVDKPWGVEYVLDLGDVLVKVIQVNDGHATSLQHHEIKDEVHFILRGNGTIDGTSDVVDGKPRPSKGYRVRPGQIHRAIGPVLMLEFSTNHPDDVVRHADDYGRSDVGGDQT